MVFDELRVSEGDADVSYSQTAQLAFVGKEEAYAEVRYCLLAERVPVPPQPWVSPEESLQQVEKCIRIHVATQEVADVAGSE